MMRTIHLDSENNPYQSEDKGFYRCARKALQNYSTLFFELLLHEQNTGRTDHDIFVSHRSNVCDFISCMMNGNTKTIQYH